jgi:hypothetical protein
VGFELGAATVNIIITLGLIIVGVTVGMILTAPHFAVVPIVLGLVVAALVVPVLVYPMSYTLWQALDLVMRPPEPGEMPSPPVIRGNA